MQIYAIRHNHLKLNVQATTCCHLLHNVKAADLQMLRKLKIKIKLTVSTGQVMFSGEIYCYWPLIQLTKSLVKIAFLCIIYCVTNAVAVMYMYCRNTPMAETRIVCFQSKPVKICSFFISKNYYIYLKRYFEIFVTNDFLVYSGGQLL